MGTEAGAVFSHFNTNTSTSVGPLFNVAEANAVNQAGAQTINTPGFFGGIVAGYNWQFKQLLLGLETDIQSLSISGETHTGAIPSDNPNNQFVLTTYGNNNWLWTLRPRVGLVTPQGLFYATGGLGLTFLQNDFVFSSSLGNFESQRISRAKAGYVIGGGVEKRLTDYLSLKAEYLFSSFDKTAAQTMAQNLSAGQQFSNTATLYENMVALGLNYHFDSLSGRFMPTLLDSNDWENEIGAQVFFSTGIDGAPQPLLSPSNIGNTLASRLIFSDLKAVSEEVSARLNHKSGLFIKGYLGAGRVENGQLNDEDFPAFNAYSNTLSHATGNLSYATVDVGYSFLKKDAAKAGFFVGYNYYAQHLNTYSCMQLAGDIVCVPASPQTNFLGISEDDHFNSLRVGVASQLYLTAKLSLTSEVAYIPVVSFVGLDFHNARQLVVSENASHGNGAMLESALSYQFNQTWRGALGARYWTWNMPGGSVGFEFLGQNGLGFQPGRFNTTRYGEFIQVSYHPMPSRSVDSMNDSVDWNGLFIGGHLGGAWGNNRWADPFGTTPAAPGYYNIPGFGDNLRDSGALGGGSLNLNWQKGRLVYGVGVNLNGGDIRGENTLFSGIGGVNGQVINHYFGTIVGRVGTTLPRSLLYMNAGTAVVNTEYNVNANTGVLALGEEAQKRNTWGWTVGVGVEYAFDNQWTSSIEYDYMGIPSQELSFPTLPQINAQSLAIKQALNVVKLTINYKILESISSL